MPELNGSIPTDILQSIPGGIAKLAFDDILTILYASDYFLKMIKNVSDHSTGKKPGALLRMVYSADIIYVTQQIAAQKHRKDNNLSLKFRTLDQDGSIKWIMIKGNKTEEIHQSGSRSVPVYSCVATDITNLMVNYKKLEQKIDYQRAISELSKDLFFEYEIASDTMTFTELYHDIFGLEPVITGFRQRLEKTKKIHPDELPAVFAIYNSVMNGRKQVRFELRILPKDGVYSWYTCYASIIFDENRNPFMVVGKLSIRNPLPKDLETTQYEPVLDVVTNVCTKESAEIMINEAMSKQMEEALSALFIIEIRNYKGLNEIKKSINGDNILTLIGNVLNNKFRTNDIIGRTGIGEFVVYMNNLHSDKIVYETANSLCSEINELYPYGHTKNGLYASIGIAFAKGVPEYQTLLANSKTALIMAKKVSSGSFEVFSGNM